MSAASALEALLESSTAAEVHGSRGVWRLSGKPSSDSLRVAMLEAAASAPGVFVHYDEDTPEEPTLAGARLLARGLWRLPSGAAGADLAAWLYMGNWQLYARSEPLLTLTDLCRASDEEVRAFVSSTGVPFIIDSFHDDTQWTIGLLER